MTVKTKLIVALSLILISTFLATSFINYTVTRETIREELLHSSLPLTGKNIYSEIQEAMMRPLLVSTSMSHDTFLKSWVKAGEHDTNQIRNYLLEIKRKYGFLTAFFVSLNSDAYYNEDGILKRVGARDPRDVWFYSFIRTRKPHALNVDLSEGDNDTLSIFVNCRVEDENGHLLGATGVGLNIDQVANRLQQVQDKYNRAVYLVDQDGLVQVHQDRALIGQLSITKAEGIRDVAPLILGERDKPLALEYDRKGRHHLLSAQFIPDLRWYLIVDQDEASALEPARENLIRTLIIGGGVSVIVILLCMVVINHFQTRLEDLARTDPLTGAANRRALEDRFAQAAYKADRYGSAFSAIIIDLDKFKEINDTYGHLKGDAVLKRVAAAIKATIRPSDLLARWGGDEFIILLDGEMEDAEILSCRVLEAVADMPEEPSVSFSHGLAEYRQGDDLGSMTMRADKQLYEAKNIC